MQLAMNRQHKPVQIEADAARRIMPKLNPRRRKSPPSSLDRKQQQQQVAEKHASIDRRGKHQMRQHSLPENLHRHHKEQLTTIYEDQTDESGNRNAYQANSSLRDDLMTKEEKQAILLEEARKLERRIERIKKRLEHSSTPTKSQIPQHRRSSYPTTLQSPFPSSPSPSSSSPSSSDSMSSSDSSTIAQNKNELAEVETEPASRIARSKSTSTIEIISSAMRALQTNSSSTMTRSDSFEDLRGKERRNEEMMQGLCTDVPRNRWEA